MPLFTFTIISYDSVRPVKGEKYVVKKLFYKNIIKPFLLLMKLALHKFISLRAFVRAILSG